MHPQPVQMGPVETHQPTVSGTPGPRHRGTRTTLMAGVIAIVFAAGVAVGQGGRPGSVSAGSGPQASDGATASHQPGGPGSVVPSGAPEDFGVFWEALQLIKDRYVDPSKLGDENLTWGAIRGMVDSLGDTGHTVFLTPDEVQAQNDQLTGHISGIGIIVDTRAGMPLIVSVIDGSPADAAGLHPGDLITSVDGQQTERMTVSEVIDHVRGKAGTTVTLGIRHRDGTAAEIPLVRAEITVPQVSWAFVPGTKVADIRLSQFSQGAVDGVRAALQEAIDQGATGVTLDLRGNPGGLEKEAIAIAGLFLPEGTTVLLEQDRSGEQKPVLTTGSPEAPDLPVVVLADYGSASSAEILAAALQDNHRAQVVGQRTFGTGTVLNVFPLSDGSAVRLGVIEWLTPDGEGIFDTGITPDVEVALPADGAPTTPNVLAHQTRKEFRQGTDTQLQRAVKALTHPTASPNVSPAP
jgi:carboxyl-terminal processing protease